MYGSDFRQLSSLGLEGRLPPEVFSLTATSAMSVFSHRCSHRFVNLLKLRQNTKKKWNMVFVNNLRKAVHQSVIYFVFRNACVTVRFSLNTTHFFLKCNFEHMKVTMFSNNLFCFFLCGIWLFFIIPRRFLLLNTPKESKKASQYNTYIFFLSVRSQISRHFLCLPTNNY